MKQTTNYILLFSLLVYLKFNNNDTIKIGISLLITYIVYQLFKKDNIEGSEAPIGGDDSPDGDLTGASCSGKDLGEIITGACSDIPGVDSLTTDGSCQGSPPNLKMRCICDTNKGSQRIGSSGYNFTKSISNPIVAAYAPIFL